MLLCVALLLFSSVSSLHANTWTTFGFGPRAVAIGGAFTAVADDFTGGYYNPAGILSPAKAKAGMGWQYVKNNLKANGSAVDSAKDTNALFLGASMPIPFTDELKNRIGFGYYFFQPLWYTVDVSIPATTAPQFPVLESTTRMQLISVALAADFIPGVLVGAGVTVGNKFGASLSLEPGLGGFGGVKEVISTVDQQVTTTLSATAGLLCKPGRYYKPLEPLSLGFTFRDRFYMEMEFPVVVVLSGFLLTLDLNSTLIYSPRQYVFGVAWQKPRYLVSLDVSYNQWSDFRAPSLSIATQIDIPLITLKQGYKPEPNFKDTVTPHLGFEALAFSNNFLNVYGRAGYFFEPSPAPGQTGITNYLDSHRNVFSWGFGVLLKRIGKFDLTNKPVSFDVGIAYQWLLNRENRKRPDVRPENPGYPEISSSGNIWYFALGFTYGTKPGGTRAEP
jgi:long-chain fatty acid transport protein